VHSQGSLNPFFLTVRSLATPQRHIIISPDTWALATNISWHVSCYFLMLGRIFSICVTSCSLVIRRAYQH